MPINMVLTWTVQGSDPEEHKNDVLIVNTTFTLYKIQSARSNGGGSSSSSTGGGNSAVEYIRMKHGQDFATRSTIQNPCFYSEGFYHNGSPYRRYDFVWRDLAILRQGTYYLEFVVSYPPSSDSEPGQVLGSMSSRTFRIVNDSSGRISESNDCINNYGKK
jgi:hypothetical protein